jgi:hypothetical protein
MKSFMIKLSLNEIVFRKGFIRVFKEINSENRSWG